MSTASAAGKAAVNGIRLALGLGGLLALIAGIIIVWQPVSAAVFVTVILAIYAIAAGLVYLGLGLFTKDRSGWGRIGYILLGVVFVAAGIIAFFNLQPTATWLAVFVAIFIGIAWIIEGIVSLSTLGDAASKGWTIFFAIVSIIAGLYLVFSPLLSALWLWWILGIALIVIGILNVVRAFTFGRDV